MYIKANRFGADWYTDEESPEGYAPADADPASLDVPADPVYAASGGAAAPAIAAAKAKAKPDAGTVKISTSALIETDSVAPSSSLGLWLGVAAVGAFLLLRR